MARLAFADTETKADWHKWMRLGDQGDRALEGGRAGEAEKLYRKALELGATLRATPDLDPHLSRLVASLAAQGKCSGGRPDADALLGMLSLARNDPGASTDELQRVVVGNTSKESCQSTVALEVLALLRWWAGDEEAALVLREKAITVRCKALMDDPLDQAATALNNAWKSGEEKRWAEALAIVSARLGPHHPLLALALERRAALLQGGGNRTGAKEVRRQLARVRQKPYCKG